MKGRKLDIVIILYYIVIFLCIWVSVTTLIYRFEHPKMTETQLFLNIPKAIILKF
jgi:hypothetical protein